MSFGYYARRVRDGTRSPWRRLSNLRGCVSSFCWLTRRPYRATLEALDLDWQYGVPRDPPTEAFLLATLERLEAERSAFLAGLRELVAERVEAKRKGNRQLSSAERARFRALSDGVDG